MLKKVKLEYYQEWAERKRKLIRVEEEEWEHCSDIHCPRCTEKSVWKGPDKDRDWGSEFICVGCGASFHMPCLHVVNDEGMQVIRQIKES